MSIYDKLFDALGLSFICLIPIIWIGLFYIKTEGRKVGITWFISFGLFFFTISFLSILFLQTDKVTQEIVSRWGVWIAIIIMVFVTIKGFYAKLLLGGFYKKSRPRGYIFGVLFSIVVLSLIIESLTKNESFEFREIFPITLTLTSIVLRMFLEFQIQEKGISNFLSIYKLRDIKKIEWVDKSRIEKIRITKLYSEKQITLNVPKDLIYVIDDYIKKHFPST